MRVQQKASNGKNVIPKSKLSELAKSFRDQDYVKFQTILQEIKRLDPGNPNAIHLEGLYALQVENDVARAHTLVSQASEILPESPAINHNLATIKITRGEFVAAERLLLLAVHMQPDYAEAFHTLAGIRKFKSGDPIIEKMELLAGTKKFSNIDASFLCFALAKAYDDVGRYEDAWRVLVQGNTLMTETYPTEAYPKGFKAVKEVFTKAFLSEKSSFGHPAKAPIFIVGMPRSGTTLLESVLGSNPLIRNAGELPAIHSLSRKTAQIYGTDVNAVGHAALAKAMPQDHLFRWGEAYLTYAQSRLGVWAEYFTDKLPDNSFNLGLISLLLPNAKFIHIRRDPMDIALSIYFQRFTTLNYGFRIKTIVKHYRNYQIFMDYWHDVFEPERLIDVDYEHLVDNKEDVFNRIHAQLGLTMPSGHVAERQDVQNVSTASRWQARQPIYASSKQKWKKYEAQLVATEAAELLST